MSSSGSSALKDERLKAYRELLEITAFKNRPRHVRVLREAAALYDAELVRGKRIGRPRTISVGQQLHGRKSA